MPYMLALDCSTARGSIAVGYRAREEPPVICWETDFPAGRGQGGEMFSVLQEAIAIMRAGEEWIFALKEIVVGLGPGSYSGVRQAIAAATGLAAATGAALWGVPSALALAPVSEVGGVRMTEGEFAWWSHTFHAVGDARRGAFYYTAVQAGICLAGPELLADAAELATRLGVHPEWPTCAVESALPSGVLPDAMIALPTAAALLFAAPSTRQLPPLEPIYLRPVSITLPKPRPTTAVP